VAAQGRLHGIRPCSAFGDAGARRNDPGL